MLLIPNKMDVCKVDGVFHSVMLSRTVKSRGTRKTITGQRTLPRPAAARVGAKLVVSVMEQRADVDPSLCVCQSVTVAVLS